MVFFRRLGLALVTTLFSTLLLTFVAALSFYMVFDKPDVLKASLRQHQIYHRFVEDTLKQQIGNKLPVDNPLVQQALKVSFSPPYLQKATENTLDRAYDWVHGKTAEPELAVDLSTPKQRFLDTLSASLEQRAETLPVCTNPATTPADLEAALNLTCRPRGVSTEQLVSSVRAQLAQSEFFRDDTFTLADVKDSRGRPLSERLAFVPQLHTYYIWSLYLMPLVLVLSGLAIIFWSASRRGGVKLLGWLLVVGGITSILTSLTISWLLRWGADALANQEGSILALHRSLLQVVNDLAADLRFWWIGLGVLYVVLGTVLWLVLKFKKSKKREKAEQLNTALGYRDVPTAGTRFVPQTDQNDTEAPYPVTETSQQKQDQNKNSP